MEKMTDKEVNDLIFYFLNINPNVSAYSLIRPITNKINEIIDWINSHEKSHWNIK